MGLFFPQTAGSDRVDAFWFGGGGVFQYFMFASVRGCLAWGQFTKTITTIGTPRWLFAPTTPARCMWFAHRAILAAHMTGVKQSTHANGTSPRVDQ